MAVPPSYNLPGLPNAPIADPETGALTDVWRAYLQLQMRLVTATAFANVITGANALQRSAPLLATAANDAAAAALVPPVQVGQYYWTGAAVVQRRV